MKNKFIIIFVVFFFSLNNFLLALAEEYIFEVTDLEIIENGNIYKGNNRGKIKTDNQLEITSNNFKYYKKINKIEATGNVQLTDIVNNIIIDTEEIFYLKDEEKIFTSGKTLINVSNQYNIEGYDLTFLKDKMILSSKKTAVITDNESNIYKIEEFQYSINDEILKGKNITVTTSSKNNQSDNFFFQEGFFDLKKNKFLAKDVSTKLHKNLFGNKENDPRINSVSAYGDEFNTYFKKGIFTSCKKTDKCPPWKITSDEIHHDRVKKQINYKNAWLEIYDFPVVYFPRFFHPDPSVKRQSGILKPELGSSNNLGSSIYIPYFLAISDDKDLTIKPKLYEDNKFLLQNEYRQKTKNSITLADFSFVNGHNSSTQDKGGTRSHLFTDTLLDLTLDKFKRSMLKINYQKVSNDNYLKLFDLQSPLLLDDNSVLESKIELDLEHENYDLTTSFEMYETLNGSNNDRYQYVLPSYNFSKNFNIEILKGSFNFNSFGNNTLNNTNISTSSLSNDLVYSTLNNFFDNGIKTNSEIFFKNINTVGKNNSLYKNSPQSELMSAYTYNVSVPMIKKNLKSFNTLEPRLSFRFSPHEMKNNSELSRRINIDNIFSSNRLSMSDSFESGESVTLGLNFKKERTDTKNKITEVEEYIDFKLASVFRLKDEKNIPTNSSLNKKKSNIFGQFNFKPLKNISLDYNFSLSENFNEFNYNSLITEMKFGNFTTQFNYLEERGVVGQTNLIENTTEYNFDDQNFISFNTRRNRKLDLTEYYNLVYEYKNDCLIAGIKYKKNYYNDGDIKPVEELFFSITIIPLGTFSPDKMILNKSRID
jgi:LPS-assembly protein